MLVHKNVLLIKNSTDIPRKTLRRILYKKIPNKKKLVIYKTYKHYKDGMY